MNMLSTMDGIGSLSLLEQWALMCNEIPAAKLPRAILEVCQIIADEQPCDDLAEQVARKRRVFERVAIGDKLGAIRAMIPDGFEVEMLGKRGGVFAIVKNIDGVDARSAGPTREAALLGAAIQLAIRHGYAGGPTMFASGVADSTVQGPDSTLAA